MNWFSDFCIFYTCDVSYNTGRLAGRPGARWTAPTQITWEDEHTTYGKATELTFAPTFKAHVRHVKKLYTVNYIYNFAKEKKNYAYRFLTN